MDSTPENTPKPPEAYAGMLSSAAACKYVGISDPTLRTHRDSGALPFVRGADGKYWHKRADLDTLRDSIADQHTELGQLKTEHAKAQRDEILATMKVNALVGERATLEDHLRAEAGRKTAHAEALTAYQAARKRALTDASVEVPPAPEYESAEPLIRERLNELLGKPTTREVLGDVRPDGRAAGLIAKAQSALVLATRKRLAIESQIALREMGEHLVSSGAIDAMSTTCDTLATLVLAWRGAAQVAGIYLGDGEQLHNAVTIGKTNIHIARSSDGIIVLHLRPGTAPEPVVTAAPGPEPEQDAVHVVDRRASRSAS